MSPTSPAPDAARRRFIKLVGLAGLSGTVGAPVIALAQSAGSGARPRPRAPKPPPAAPPAGAKPPEISEDARALAGIVERRYGDHLTSEQLEAVTRELDSRLQGGKRLRAAALSNADEPDCTFRA